MRRVPIRSSARHARARWSAVVVAALLGFAAPAAAQDPVAPGSPDAATAAPDAPPPHDPHARGRPPGRWQRPPFDAVLAREAGRLGLDEAALARIRAIADAARPETERLEAQLRDERHALHRLLSADAPDRDAAMRQVERIGAADTALEKQRIATLLEIRQLLTPAQRAELVKIFRERRPEREKEQREGPER